MAHSVVAFEIQPSVRVIRGAGALDQLGEAAASLGGKRVLVVTDPGLEGAGHPQRAIQSLERAGLSVAIFDGVEENPTTRHVENGARVAREHKTEVIVAVGGGSTMDCAKGINFLLTNGGQMRDYWGKNKAPHPMLPSIGIPTTAGTGSEAQCFALICDPESHLKMACGDKKAAFRIAILDPELTVTQPPNVAALTGMDAISHAVEAYVTRTRNPYSQMLAGEAWRLLEANLETVLVKGDNLTARAAMQWGAHLAGMAIENSMLGATHALANPLTAHYGMPHGQAIGIMLPHVVAFNGADCAAEYERLADLAHLPTTAGLDASNRIANRVAQMARVAGIPRTLAECGVSKGMLTVLADEASEQWTGKHNPRPVGYDELLELYRAAFE